MNKELLNQIPADEQPTASKLFSTAETMKVPHDFQWKLETQLMEAHKSKTKPQQSWYGNITRAVGWAVLALGGILILSWAIRSVIPRPCGGCGRSTCMENGSPEGVFAS